MKSSPLTGGREEALLSGIDKNNVFHGIQLKESTCRTDRAHAYVLSERLFSAIRSEIIDSPQSFLSDHLAIDDLESAINALRPEQFPNLDDVTIRLIHRILLPDFELREVSRSLKIVSETVQEANQLTSS